MKESFWGDVCGQTRLCLKKWLEQDSLQQREEYLRQQPSERPEGKAKRYRNGFYERDWVTRFGTIRLRIARARDKNFLPVGLRAFQRRAEEVGLLIRETFLRGISTRQVGRIVATFTGEPVSAQTVSRLTRSLDTAVEQFPAAPMKDEGAYLFLDGVSLRMRQAGNRKRVHMLVAYGVKADATRQLLAFLRSPGESQADWGGLRQGLFANLLQNVAHFVHPAALVQPELLNFFGFPPHLWKKLRTTNVIERVFVEVRRRTRPMVCFVNVQSVDRIIYSIFPSL